MNTPRSYYNDNEPYCCRVLQKNIDAGNLPGGYVDGRDIRDVHATDFAGYAHIHLFAGIGGFPLGMVRANYPAWLRTITGGFPCTDISNAGKRAGITGPQSSLWKEMYRLIGEATDSGMGFDYVLLENVSALVNRGLATVLGNLAQAGYDAEWLCLRAADVGAPHKRERIFIVAYPDGNSRRRTQRANTGSLASTSRTDLEREGYSQRATAQCSSTNVADSNSSQRRAHPQGRQDVANGHDTGWQETASRLELCREAVADPSGAGLEEWLPLRGDLAAQCATAERGGRASAEWAVECRLGRDFTRLPAGLDRYQWPARPGEAQHDWEPPRTLTGKQPHRVSRLKALGNAIVPQLIELIARRIVAYEEERGAA